jgi:acetyl-CoA acetyltransferase family protein
LKELKEAVVIEAVRTPTGKSVVRGKETKGAFSDLSAHYLIEAVIHGLIDRVKAKSPKFDPVDIEDCAVTCQSPIGEQAMIGRMAVLVSDLPEEVSGWALTNTTGIKAINALAHAIMVGDGDIMIAAGLEHMSRYPLMSVLESAIKGGYPMSAHPNFERRGGYVMPGTAAEVISDQYGLDREQMDRFGLWSHQKAVKAMREEEWYSKRVVPVTVSQNGSAHNVDKDEPPRPIALDDPETAWTQIQELEPRFKEGGQVTAGSSSGIADGAAAVMLMSKDKAKELGLEPMVTIRSTAAAGGDPFFQFLAPIPAMNKAMARAGVTISDMDVLEFHESFAAPVLAYCKEFDIAFDDPRMNPTGGAIAIGNPTGCSGALFFTEMVHWIVRNDLRWGLIEVAGVQGVGIATVVEREK